VTVETAGTADPVADPSGVFQEGLARGELRYQRCRWCADRSARVRLLCSTCGGSDFVWERSSGRGRIHRIAPPATVSVEVERAVVVELDEGFRMHASVAAVPAHRLWAGAPVQLEVATGEDGALRPLFRPVAA
jgi:uncharacterized OB-fold protein